MAPLLISVARRQELDLADEPLPEPFQTATPASPTRDTTTTRDDDETSTATRSATSRSSSASSLGTTTSPSTSPTRSSDSSTASTSSNRSTSSTTSMTSSTQLASSSVRTGSLPSESMIWPNSFPPDFPVETHEAVKVHAGGRGYAFLKDSELLDSLLIFVSFFLTALVLTIILIKTTQMMSRRQGSKVDQMVGEDMKWAERREVLERKIIWEGSRSRARGGKIGRGADAQAGWKELSERERLKGI